MTFGAGGRIPKPLSRLIFVIILILAALVLGDLNDRMTRAQALERDVLFLETQIADLNQEVGSLEAEVEYAESEAAVVAWAHKEAKWVRPGEKLVFLKSAGEGQNDATPPPPSVSKPTPSNLEIWLEVLFGR